MRGCRGELTAAPGELAGIGTELPTNPAPTPSPASPCGRQQATSAAAPARKSRARRGAASLSSPSRLGVLGCARGQPQLASAAGDVMSTPAGRRTRQGRCVPSWTGNKLSPGSCPGQQQLCVKTSVLEAGPGGGGKKKTGPQKKKKKTLGDRPSLNIRSAPLGAGPV